MLSKEKQEGAQLWQHKTAEYSEAYKDPNCEENQCSVVSSVPKNDRNVEKMRNNDEEWNNNMIAAYLNTQSNSEYKHDSVSAVSVEMNRAKQKTHSQTKKLLLRKIKREFFRCCLKHFAFFRIAIKFSFGCSSQSFPIISFFRSFFFSVHIHLFSNYLRSHTLFELISATAIMFVLTNVLLYRSCAFFFLSLPPHLIRSLWSLMSFQTRLFVHSYVFFARKLTGLNFRLLGNKSFNRLFQNIDFFPFISFVLEENAEQLMRIKPNWNFSQYTIGNYRSHTHSNAAVICYFQMISKKSRKKEKRREKQQLHSKYVIKTVNKKQENSKENNDWQTYSTISCRFGSVRFAHVSNVFGHFSNGKNVSDYMSADQSNREFLLIFSASG